MSGVPGRTPLISSCVHPMRHHSDCSRLRVNLPVDLEEVWVVPQRRFDVKALRKGLWRALGKQRADLKVAAFVSRPPVEDANAGVRPVKGSLLFREYAQELTTIRGRPAVRAQSADAYRLVNCTVGKTGRIDDAITPGNPKDGTTRLSSVLHEELLRCDAVVGIRGGGTLPSPLLLFKQQPNVEPCRAASEGEQRNISTLHPLQSETSVP